MRFPSKHLYDAGIAPSGTPNPRRSPAPPDQPHRLEPKAQGEAALSRYHARQRGPLISEWQSRKEQLDLVAAIMQGLAPGASLIGAIGVHCRVEIETDLTFFPKAS
jgi:hypothetical protein